MTEAEWLSAWRAALVAVEDLPASLEGVELTDVQVAHLAGEAAMLRRVLESRGVDLD